MKKFIFIGDEREINQTNNLEIQTKLKAINPNIEYQYITPQKMNKNKKMILKIKKIRIKRNQKKLKKRKKKKIENKK